MGYLIQLIAKMNTSLLSLLLYLEVKNSEILVKELHSALGKKGTKDKKERKEKYLNLNCKIKEGLNFEPKQLFLMLFLQKEILLNTWMI